jgi:hypothetical protein
MTSSRAPSDFVQFERDGWQRVAAKYGDAWSGLTRLFIANLLDAAGVEAGQGPYEEESCRFRRARDRRVAPSETRA